jgi:EmrB/QacA subfamily drug resistance transporter
LKKWLPLTALALAQFVMVLDQAVMNVSISQLVEDFDTTVTTIQGVITLYTLVMAMFMLTGGKIGDIIGRKRAFVIGLIIYACGSALTAVSQSVLTLTLGWSVLEGLGAALVLPALAALIAGNFEGRARVSAYAVIGGVAGAGIAVGPILGGWATTVLSWRVVFVGEVILVLIILVLARYVSDAPREGRKPSLDVVGSALSALGLGAIVLGILMSSTWGFVQPKDSPIEPLGFSLTVYVIGAGIALLYAFARWERHREATGQDPLVHLDLLKIDVLRAGLANLLSQNFILMGIFFVVPLYLQLVLGFDALETGIKMLPVSITMFITSALGARLILRYSVRTIIRAGLIIDAVAILILIAAIEPQMESLVFALSMALLGVGMGLLASQLGNVVQSSVDASGRSEAGGLQYTAQQLGSSLGVALIGAVVIVGLSSNFFTAIVEDERISEEVAVSVAVAVDGSVEFVATSDVSAAVEASELDEETGKALVQDYEAAQLQALRTGLLVAAAVALLALLFTRKLPSRRPTDEPESEAVPAIAST